MRLRRRIEGGWVTLSRQPFGIGGEAKIYAVERAPNLVAKIYHQPTKDRYNKLQVMMAHPPVDPITEPGHVSIAWPVDLLCTRDPRSAFVGFLMPRVSGMRPILDYYNPGTRHQYCPLFNWRYLHRTARNLAAAFAALHGRGYIIGDVNESNILVSERALVTMVDTDSFQVKDPSTGQIYRCPVGKPEYTPPELQSVTFTQVDRLPHHDRFGLAVLIFKLLMEGTHPFAGIFQGRGDPPLLEERISSGHFPYARATKAPYRPKPMAPPLSILPNEVQQLFLQCFEEGHHHPDARPDAQVWRAAIERAETALITCHKNEQHHYSNHLSACPWCERSTQLGGLDPFPSRAAARPQPRRMSRKPMQAETGPMPPTLTRYARSTAARSPSHSGGSFVSKKDLLPGWVLLISIVFIVIVISPGLRSCPAPSTRRSVSLPEPVKSTGANRVQELQTSIPRPPGPFTILAWSPDGRRLASGASDLAIKIWDIKNYRVLTALTGHTDWVKSVAWSPDSRRLVSGSDDGTIRVWDVESSQLIATLTGHKMSVSSVAWSPDGLRLASGSFDETIKIWNAVTYQLTATLRGHTRSVNSVSWSPDGRWLASGSYDDTIKVWNAENHGLVITLFQTLTGHRDWIKSVSWSPDSRHIASGSFDKTIKVWNAQTGEAVATLTGHLGSVYAVAWSSHTGKMASASADATIKIWEVSSGVIIITLLSQSSAVHSIGWSPDGQLLASGLADGIIKIWDAQAYKVITTLDSIEH